MATKNEKIRPDSPLNSSDLPEPDDTDRSQNPADLQAESVISDRKPEESGTEGELEWDGKLLELDDALDVDALLESYRRIAEEEDKTFRMMIDQNPERESRQDNGKTVGVPAAEPSAEENIPKGPESAEEVSGKRKESSDKKQKSKGKKENSENKEKKEEKDIPKLKAEEYLIDTPAYMGLEGNTPRRKRRRRRPHFLYYIAESFRGIASHGFMSFAAVGIITACLLIMGTFSLVAVNVNNEINQLMDNNEFLAYVEDSYTEEEARALESQILAIENVKEVTFITREEALESYVSDLDDSTLYEDLDESVLRDRYSVKVEDLALIEETSEEVAAIEGIAKISIEIDVANGFVTLRNVVMLVALVLVAILFIISLFIISNTIKLATISRKDEIAVMRMVGATKRFIRWPFIYQGAILGLLGALIAFGLQTALYIGVVNAITVAGGDFVLDLIAWEELGAYVLIVFVAAGLVIGVCGSSMAIRKFLKV